MDNLIKHIEEKCEDKSIKGVVKFLFLNGDLSYKSEMDREIYFFYVDAMKMLGNKKEARDTTIELFDITWRQFNYIRKMYE